MAKNQSRRIFKIPDADMFQETKTKRGFFIEDKTDFINFDGDFADPFAGDWLTDITDAEALPTDETLDDQTVQLSNTVEDEMVKCRNKFQDSKYFIEKTFPDNTAVWNEFGYNDYKEARKSQVKMIQFMKKFHGVAEKYKVQLIPKGFTQMKIDEIETRRAALDAANQAQELFLGNLPVQTQSRISDYNDVWNIMVNVCTAGKRIFKNNFAKYQRYLLPPGEESPEALSIVGKVSDSVSGTPLAGALCDLQPINLQTNSAADGSFGFGGLPDGNYALTVSLTDYVTQNIPVVIANGELVEVEVKLVHV